MKNFIKVIAILFSMSAMANKSDVKHYKLTELEAGTKWLYYYKQELNTGLLSNKLKIEKCFNMNIENGEKLEIPCAEMDKIKTTLDLREISVTERSVSAI